MELWIRSQDKETLTKVEVLVREDNMIVDYYQKRLVLGTYKSKKRTLEILDEIQKLLMPISKYKQEVDNLIINYENIDACVYEMPKE